MEFTQQGQAILVLAEMVDKAYAEDTLHEIIFYRHVKDGYLKCPDTLSNFLRPAGHADIDHVLAVVAGMDDTTGLFDQHIPKATGTAWRVQHRFRIAGDAQCLARDLVIAQIRKPPPQAVIVLEQILLGVLIIVFSREFKLRRAFGSGHDVRIGLLWKP